MGLCISCGESATMVSYAVQKRQENEGDKDEDKDQTSHRYVKEDEAKEEEGGDEEGDEDDKESEEERYNITEILESKNKENTDFQLSINTDIVLKLTQNLLTKIESYRKDRK